MAIASCDFRLNSASEYGAAVCAESYRNNLTISGSEFTTNGASWGGALSVLKTSADAFISSSDFTSNSADQGGAVFLYTWNDQTTHISSTLFSANTASSPSSGVYGYDGLTMVVPTPTGEPQIPMVMIVRIMTRIPDGATNTMTVTSRQMKCAAGVGVAKPARVLQSIFTWDTTALFSANRAALICGARLAAVVQPPMCKMTQNPMRSVTLATALYLLAFRRQLHLRSHTLCLSMAARRIASTMRLQHAREVVIFWCVSHIMHMGSWGVRAHAVGETSFEQRASKPKCAPRIRRYKFSMICN